MCRVAYYTWTARNISWSKWGTCMLTHINIHVIYIYIYVYNLNIIILEQHYWVNVHCVASAVFICIPQPENASLFMCVLCLCIIALSHHKCAATPLSTGVCATIVGHGELERRMSVSCYSWIEKHCDNSFTFVIKFTELLCDTCAFIHLAPLFCFCLAFYGQHDHICSLAFSKTDCFQLLFVTWQSGTSLRFVWKCPVPNTKYVGFQHILGLFYIPFFMKNIRWWTLLGIYLYFTVLDVAIMPLLAFWAWKWNPILLFIRCETQYLVSFYSIWIVTEVNLHEVERQSLNLPSLLLPIMHFPVSLSVQVSVHHLFYLYHAQLCITLISISDQFFS